MSEPYSPARRLADSFRLGDPHQLSVVARGAMGRVYRLDTASGSYAAKECLWEIPADDDLAVVADFIDRCRGVGIQAPRWLTDERRRYVHVGEDGVGWTLQEWAAGSPPTTSTDLDSTRWLLRQAALIHALAEPGPDGDDHGPWYCRVDDRWDEVVAAAERAGLDWARPLAARRQEIRQFSELVNAEPLGPTVMCHRDLQPANTLLATDGHRLLDWDNAGPHEPWREVGTMLLHLLGEDVDLRELVGTYQDAGGVPLPAGVTLFASGLAIWLNFLQAQALIAVDAAAENEHRSFAEDRVSAMVTNLPSLAELEQAAARLAD
jgi:hypothetical protein